MTDDELRRENAELHARVAALEHTAAKYRALCKVTSDLVLVIDRDGRYVEIDETRNFPPELITKRMGTTIRETFPADVAEEMIAAVRRTLATGEHSRLEYFVPVTGSVQRHTAVLAALTATSVLWFSQDVTGARRLERAERSLRIFEAIVESTPDGIALIAPDGAFGYMNSAYRALLGGEAPARVRTLLDVRADMLAAVSDGLKEALAHGSWQGRLTLRRTDGTELPCQVSIVRLNDEGERSQRLAVIARDLTSFVEAERQRVELQEQVIAAQRTALRELSTPLLPLADGVIAMPLIGTLDQTRAQEVMETLLEGVVRKRAHTAILDVTGIRTLDSHAAEALIRVARAARLLGTRVILTGVGPHVAHALVQLDADLREISVRGTLQSGIAEALQGAAGPRR